jgi:acetyl esterase
MRSTPNRSERFRGKLARALDGMPAELRLRLSKQPAIEIDGQRLDPTVQLAMRFREAHGRADLTLSDPPAARARLRREILSARGPKTEMADVATLTVQGADRSLRGRLYRPVGVGNPPLVVYFHGGGFTQGDLETHDEACRLLAAGASHAVLSVAYRLAPEDPFPAAVEDAVASFRWAQEHAKALGMSARRVCVGGDSAGGNLAAVVAQETRDDRPPLAQLLIYPTVDPHTPRPSRELFDGFFLSEDEREAFHALYTDGMGVDPKDPRQAPLHGRLDGLAPALVVTAGFDVLRDEGKAYAEALAAAGTRAEHLHEPALAHGFLNLTGISRSCHAAGVRMAEGWRALVADLPF